MTMSMLDTGVLAGVGSGLGMLIGGLTTLKKADGVLKLASVTDKIESLLMITKLITIFESYDTVDEAVQAFAS